MEPTDKLESLFILLQMLKVLMLFVAEYFPNLSSVDEEEPDDDRGFGFFGRH